jgi:alpha-aminoadipic semialdehyde synthase
VIGIRREDKNEWERRVPLTPDHVARLVEHHGLAFKVQPFPQRAFSDLDYRKAGASIDDDLTACRLILGVKEIPIQRLLREKTYVFFSHTTKGQPYNMPLLARLLDLRCTLIDYEHIADERGRRLIFFGRHAGYAGMLDTLWALGRRLSYEGIHTPFERVRLAHDYSSLDEATHHVSRIGEELRHTGLPPELRPLVCGFTGSGNVTQGALEIIQRLPSIDIEPRELETLERDEQRLLDVVFTVRFARDQRYVRRDGGPQDAAELSTRPELYESGIAAWLPRLTMLVHGAYWERGQPRLVTRRHLRELWSGSPPRLRVLTDISCDIDGAIETTVKSTTPGNPAYVWDPRDDSISDGVEGYGPVVMAVDNLPCQLPTEASQHFGDTLFRYIPALARCDWSRPLEELDLPQPIVRAVVVHRGRLTPAFAQLERFLRSR